MAKIKSSDFFDNDGALKTLADQIKALREEMASYGVAMDEVRKSADKLQKQNKDLNEDTAAGKEEIMATTEQLEKLRKLMDKYNDSQSDVEVQIAAVREAQRKLNQVNKLEAKILASKEGSYNKLSATYSLVKLRLNQMSAEERKSTKEGQKLVKQSKELYEEMKRLQEETGKYTLNVGNYKSAIEDLPGPIGRFTDGLGSIRAALNALASHPIIAAFALLLGAVVALGKAFLRTERGVRLMNQVSGILSAVMGELISIADQLGGTIVKAFEDPKQAIKDLGQFLIDQIVNRFKAIPALVIAVGKAIKETFSGNFGAAREAAEDALFAVGQALTGLEEDQQRAIIEGGKKIIKAVDQQAQAWGRLENAKLDVARANRQLQKSVEELITKEQELLIIAEDDTRAFKERAEAAEQARQTTIKRAEVEIQVAKNNLALINREIALRRQSGEVVDDLLDQQLSAYQELKAAERDLSTSLLDQEQKRRQARRDELERNLDILLDGFDNVKSINERIIAEEDRSLAERSRVFAETVSLGEQSFAKQIETIQEFTDVAVDANALLAESDAVRLNERIRALGLDEIIEGRLLEIIRDRRTAVRDLVEIERELVAERRKVTAGLTQLGSVLDTRDQKIGQEDFVRFARRQRIALADAIKAQGQEADTSIFSLLGLNVDDKEREAIKSAFDFAKGQLLEFFNLRKKLADQRVKESNDAVNQAQTELQTQLRLAELGYASRVQDAQRDLALAKQTQEAALREQKKAAKAQLTIDTIQQSSNLITAAAKIWSQVGFPWAIPAIAVMFGSFAAAKVKAFQASKQTFGGGGLEIIGGGSHASGNDTDLGFNTADGSRAYGERGEAHMIIRRPMTSKYRKLLPDVFAGLNTGTFESLFTGINAKSQNIPTFGVLSNRVDTSTMERYLKKLVKLNETQSSIGPNGKRYERRRGSLNIS